MVIYNNNNKIMCNNIVNIEIYYNQDCNNISISLINKIISRNSNNISNSMIISNNRYKHKIIISNKII